MAAVCAPAFSTTTNKGQTFAVQVGNYLSRHRDGVLGVGRQRDGPPLRAYNKLSVSYFFSPSISESSRS